MATITVHIESEPHTQNLDAVLLTRPVPTGGAFLINDRIDRPIWDQMKKAGVWYVDQDYLDDMDMFDAEPGWRYSLDAVAVLLRYGFELQIRGETVTTVEQLRGMFTTEAKEAYRERVRLAGEAAERERQERIETAQREREAKGVAYAAWREEHLAGLVHTVQVPPALDTDWEQIASFDKTTPGAWYDTGDRWFQATASGQVVYKRSYGNAVQYFAPQDLVNAWIEAEDDGTAKFARHVVEYHGYGVYGSDVADRLVALRGLDHYLERAVAEEWIVTPSNGRTNDVIAAYGLPVVVVRMEDGDHNAHAARERQLRAIFGMIQVGDYRRWYTAVAQAGDGRWFATTNRYNGGDWRELTADELAVLDLDSTPPVDPPALPPATPLPTSDETVERNRRFSSLFSG